MKNEYLSIKDFAIKAGITSQAVYNRISDPSLLKFVKICNGKKTISTNALSLFSTNQVDKSVDTPLQTEISQIIEILSNQLEEKDKQISVLTFQFSEKDKQISELNERLKESNELNRNNQELNRNNQILLGRQQEQTKDIEIIEPEKKSFWSRFKSKQ